MYMNEQCVGKNNLLYSSCSECYILQTFYNKYTPNGTLKISSVYVLI